MSTLFLTLFALHLANCAMEVDNSNHFDRLPNELSSEIIYHIAADMHRPTDISHLALTNKRFNTLLKNKAVINNCLVIIQEKQKIDASRAMILLGLSNDAWWQEYLTKNQKDILGNQLKNFIFLKYAQQVQSPARLSKVVDFYKKRYLKQNIQNIRIDGIECNDGSFMILTTSAITMKTFDNNYNWYNTLDHYNSKNINLMYVRYAYQGIEKQQNGKCIFWYSNPETQRIVRVDFTHNNTTSLNHEKLDPSFGNNGFLISVPCTYLYINPDDSLRITTPDEVITYDKDGKQILSRFTLKKGTNE